MPFSSSHYRYYQKQEGAKVSDSSLFFRFRVATLQKMLWELFKSGLAKRL